MECPNGSYITQFLHKYAYMVSCPGILSPCTFLYGHLRMGITTICTHVLVEYSLCPFQYCLLPYP